MKDKATKMMHILSAKQFDRPFLESICELTDVIRRLDKTRDGLRYLKGLLSHQRAMLYFTQPSTRTFLSFQSACHILGVASSEIRDSSTSSERKGESINDSLRTFSSYVDLIIMRTPVPGLCDEIAKLLDDTPRPVPIINAGSGPDEHPTQALLDIYTLARSFRKNGGIDGKTVLMVGDLKRGRTIRSLARLLALYKDVKMIFSSPKDFSISDDLRKHLTEKGVRFEESTEFREHLKSADAIYMTRVQDEYDIAGEQKPVNYENYHLTYDCLDIIKPEAVIMHPMPRRKEIDPRIDDDRRAKYWRQERNGMWTRVALITKVLGADKNIILPEL